jgi:hypothetical protein
MVNIVGVDSGVSIRRGYSQQGEVIVNSGIGFNTLRFSLDSASEFRTNMFVQGGSPRPHIPFPPHLVLYVNLSPLGSTEFLNKGVVWLSQGAAWLSQ